MNVKELKEIIKDLPDDMEIILQIDSEGNGYNALYVADSNAVAIEDGYEYQVYDLNWTADDSDMDEDDWEEIKSMKKCLVLAP